eukprot:scaffold11360_cov114-Isochrysis_galbana.AAC.8
MRPVIGTSRPASRSSENSSACAGIACTPSAIVMYCAPVSVSKSAPLAVHTSLRILPPTTPAESHSSTCDTPLLSSRRATIVPVSPAPTMRTRGAEGIVMASGLGCAARDQAPTRTFPLALKYLATNSTRPLAPRALSRDGVGLVSRLCATAGG